MGVVYKARDPKLDRDVAIKVLHPTVTTGELVRERFIIEAKAAFFVSVRSSQNSAHASIYFFLYKLCIFYYIASITSGAGISNRTWYT